MNQKALAVVCLIAVLLAGSFAVAQQSTPATPAASATDARLDKLQKQNEEILRQQGEILKHLEEVKIQLSALRRRSS